MTPGLGQDPKRRPGARGSLVSPIFRQGEARPVAWAVLGNCLQTCTNPFSPQRRKSRYAELDFEVGPGIPSPTRPGQALCTLPAGRKGRGSTPLPGSGFAPSHPAENHAHAETAPGPVPGSEPEAAACREGQGGPGPRQQGLGGQGAGALGGQHRMGRAVGEPFRKAVSCLSSSHPSHSFILSCDLSQMLA